MKTASFVAFLFAIAAAVLAYFYLTLRQETLSAQPVERWHTNTVERWFTNTTEIVRTNTVLQPQTNTVVQYVTNFVVREVPVQVPEALQQAAVLGYKYEHAPMISVLSDSLYKASPVTVHIQTNLGTQEPLPEAALNELELRCERILRDKGVATVENSPYVLWIDIKVLWKTDVPAVSYCAVILELKQQVLVTRQEDVVKCEGSVWRSVNLALVPKATREQELLKHLQTQLEQYCAEVEKARTGESRIESALPKIPASFLPSSP